MNNEISTNNPLGENPVNSLLYQFAVPSIIAMLVSSLYNIVDQFFIGRSVGALGNAATNISFPLSISCVAIALLFGIGGASAFNIAMGMGEKENAVNYLANSAAMLSLGAEAGATAARPEGRQITYTDLYEWGLSGRPGSAERKAKLLNALGLPPRLSKKELVEALNRLYTFEQLDELQLKILDG